MGCRFILISRAYCWSIFMKWVHAEEWGSVVIMAYNPWTGAWERIDDWVIVNRSIPAASDCEANCHSCKCSLIR